MDNLALSCGGCNNHKYTKVEAVDPLSSEKVSLFHPRRNVWSEHFGWTEDGLRRVGLTAVGRATMEGLNVNREGVVNIRRFLMMAGLHPPAF